MTDAIASLWLRLRNKRPSDVLRDHLAPSSDWQTVITLAELPPELASAVQQVVSRSRLWRHEKVDIAAELVGHFQDGLDAGRTPAQLLHLFGDLHVSAQLIRRAKRRRRPAAWHYWRYGWMGLSAIFILYAGIGLWMSFGRPSVKVDYLAAFNKPLIAIREDERAWPLYRDALLALDAYLTKEISNRLLLDTIDAKPGDTDGKELDALLKNHSELLAKIREAAARPNLGFIVSTSHADFSEKDQELFGVAMPREQAERDKKRPLEDRWVMSSLLPHMQQLSKSGSLLAADARRAAATGDGGTALADIRAMLGVSRHCQESPFLICFLVADAIQNMARATIREVLTKIPTLWSNDQLRDLAHLLAGSQIDWLRGFQGERTDFYDIIQRLYTDDGHGDGRLALNVTQDKNLFELIDMVLAEGTPTRSVLSNRVFATLLMPAANIAIAGRKEMTDIYDQITDHGIARLGTPFWAWSAESPLDQEVQSLKSGPLRGFRYFVVLLFVPSQEAFLNRAVAGNGNRDGVLVGLALELYRREHNKWPQSLSELSPKYLPALPADPITGKPLHYKVVKDQPTVYSVGIDGDDDDGRTAKDKSGQSRPEYAEPKHFGRDHAAISDLEADGDWVLWSTVNSAR